MPRTPDGMPPKNRPAFPVADGLTTPTIGAFSLDGCDLEIDPTIHGGSRAEPGLSDPHAPIRTAARAHPIRSEVENVIHPTTRWSRIPILGFLLLSTASIPAAPPRSLAFAASPAAAALDGHVKYAGRAYAAFVNAPTLGIGPTFVSDTGMLATSGGFASNGLLSFGVQAAVSANVAVSVTSGENAVAKSSCAINDLIIFPGSPVEVTASFVRGETEASCTGGLKGTAEFSWLMFGGLMVPVTGLPDQKIMVPGIGTLVINERITTSVGESHRSTPTRCTSSSSPETR